MANSHLVSQFLYLFPFPISHSNGESLLGCSSSAQSDDDKSNLALLGHGFTCGFVYRKLSRLGSSHSQDLRFLGVDAEVESSAAVLGESAIASIGHHSMHLNYWRVRDRRGDQTCLHFSCQMIPDWWPSAVSGQSLRRRGCVRGGFQMLMMVGYGLVMSAAFRGFLRCGGVVPDVTCGSGAPSCSRPRRRGRQGCVWRRG